MKAYLSALALAIQVLLVPFGPVLAAGADLPELRRPLSKVDALNLALAKNGTIRQARKDVEAAAGIAIQTRAILFPVLITGATYIVRQDSLIEANRNRTIPPAQVDIPAIPALGLAEQTLSLGGGHGQRRKPPAAGRYSAHLRAVQAQDLRSTADCSDKRGIARRSGKVAR